MGGDGTACGTQDGCPGSERTLVARATAAQRRTVHRRLAERAASDAAAELAELALGLTPGRTAAARRRRLAQADEFHFAAFDAEQARQRLEETATNCEPGPLRADVVEAG